MEKKEREQLLLDLYEFQVIKGNSRASTHKDQSNPEVYQKRRVIILFWTEQGIIDKVAESTHFIEFKLTAYGIEYVEQNLKQS